MNDVIRGAGEAWREQLGPQAFAVLLAGLAVATAIPAHAAETVSVCDQVEWLTAVRQDWGVLGLDTAAHAPGQPGAPLRIGDGITCDMANWAEARLTQAPSLVARAVEPDVDIAPFGRIVTWDPNRMEGTRASRIEEFPAEDLFPETEVQPDAGGHYAVIAATNGLACLGVQWLNRRTVKELSLWFVDATQMPATNQVRVEGWFGESAWQGRWLVLVGEMRAEHDQLRFRPASQSPEGGPLLTRKVRWIWPALGDAVTVARPAVTSRSRWTTTSVLVQFERPTPVPAGFDDARRGFKRSLVGVVNGELVGEPTIRWDESQPQPLTVRYSRPSGLKSDSTLLVLSLPWDRVSVAVQDVLDHEAVYLPRLGAFLCRADKPVTLAEYKARIVGRQTVLEQVRARPDQTLAQALAKTHHAAQCEGPVMLSLACDNTKYVVERDGTVRFRTTPHTSTDWFSGAGGLRLELAGGPVGTLTRRLEGGWRPVVAITRDRGGLIVEQRTFVAPSDEDAEEPARLNRRAVGVVELFVSGALPGHAGLPLRLRFRVDPGQAASTKIVPGAPGFLVTTDQNQPVALVLRGLSGDALPAVADNALVFGPECFQNGRASWCIYLLPPGCSEEAVRDLPEPARLRTRTVAYWDAVLASATQIQTPEPFLDDLIRSSQVRCLIAARNEAEGARIAPWIAAMSYGPLESEAHAVIRGMDFLGHHEFARRGLEFFIQRYNADGFLTTGYTTFGTAWHLWTLGEHAALTRDADWLRRLAPELKRVGRWITAQTAKTRRLEERAPGTGEPAASEPGENGQPGSVPGLARVAGLMPPGVLADWNAYAHHFCLNAYYAAALREVGAALEGLGDPEAGGFQTAGESLARATEASYRLTRAESPAVPLRDGTWVPYYPSQAHSPGRLGDFFPGEDAGRSWCYDVEVGAHQLVPAGVLAPFDDTVAPMLDHMEDVQFLADGWFDYPASDNERDWFNLGGFSKVQPYYTRNAEIYALRDDVKPFIRSYFNTLAAMVNPEVMTFWEHFHHSGAWDKTHETGYFLHQTRVMLVQERGLDLWLAPMVTSNWLRDGLTVSVTNAPTRFGSVTYRLDSRVGQGQIEAEIQPPTTRPCARIVLRLRHPDGRPIQQVTVNGARHDDFEPRQGLIRLSPNLGPLRVVAEYAVVTQTSTKTP